MQEKYDLARLLAEIKEDEAVDHGRRILTVSQDDIRKMIKKRDAEGGKDT